ARRLDPVERGGRADFEALKNKVPTPQADRWERLRAMRERRVIMFAAAVLASVPFIEEMAWSQEPKSDPPRRTESTATVTDPGARFKFIERYAVEPNKAKPEVLSQYQVAMLETIKRTTEKSQGAPDRSETTFRTVYTERAARVGSGAAGEVL